MIGSAIGEKMHKVALEDAGLFHPCEPYPHLWKKMAKDEFGGKSEVIRWQMRVMDATVSEAMLLEDQALVELQPLEPPSSATNDAAGTEGGTAGAAPARKKKMSHHKTKQKASEDFTPDDDSPDGASKEQKAAAKLESAKQEADVKKEVKEEPVIPCPPCGVAAGTAKFCSECGPKIVPAEPAPALVAAVAQPEAAKGGEDESSSSEESTSSSGDERERSDDSSSSAPSQVPAATEQKSPGAEQPAAPPKQQQQQAQQTNMQELEVKIRDQLLALAGKPDELRKRMCKLEDVLQQRQAKCDPVVAKDMVARLETEFIKPLPKQPAVPSPSHRLHAPLRTCLHTCQKAPSPEEISVDPDAKSSSHRTLPKPAHASIKDGRKPRNMQRVRFSDQDPSQPGQPIVNQILVDSFRARSELWYFQAGRIANCEQCKMAVLAHDGSMLGAPKRSMFAQDTFVCNRCIYIGV